MKLANPKIAVIGAGISGSFLSYLLARNGLDVTLFEKKKNNPNLRLGKVCGGCLHHQGVAIIRKHGLEYVLEPVKKLTHVTLVSAEGVNAFTLDHGQWVNRAVLDNNLKQAALVQGAKFINQRAQILDSEAGKLAFADGEIKEFDLIICCAGIGAVGLGQWEEKSFTKGFGLQGYLAVDSVKSAHLNEIKEGEVRFYIDNNGYHGIVRVNAAQPYFHVASYLRNNKLQTSPFIAKFFQLEKLLEKSATPALYRKRAASRGKVILCGDALGYPEPFSGEGMKYALISAEQACAHVCKYFSLADDTHQEWNRKIAQFQKTQWRRSNLLSFSLRNSLRRRLILPWAKQLATRVTQ